MPTKVTIHVTKEVLERSKRCGKGPGKNRIERISHLCQIGANCAIAVAIWDVIPKVWVEQSYIGFYDEDGTRKIVDVDLPQEASDFIGLFDETPVSKRPELDPISFGIEIPDVIIDRISIDEIKKRLETCKTVELCYV